MTPEQIVSLIENLKQHDIAAKVIIAPDGTVSIEVITKVQLPDKVEPTVAPQLPNELVWPKWGDFRVGDVWPPPYTINVTASKLADAPVWCW